MLNVKYQAIFELYVLFFSFSLYGISHDASLKSDFMYYENLLLENKIYECWCSDADDQMSLFRS